MTLYVPDLGETRRFYADTFGLDAQLVDDDTAMLRFEGILVFRHQSSTAAQPLPEVLGEAGKGSLTGYSSFARSWPAAGT